MGALERLPWSLFRLAGARVYPRGLVHRFNCSLPPAPREIVTVHDVVQLRFDDEGQPPRHIGRGLQKALAVVCPSEFAANEVQTQYGLERVFVVPNGLDQSFLDAKPMSSEESRRLGLTSRYVFHAGGVTKRKNLAALAAAWPGIKSAHPDVELVLCGPPDRRRSTLFADMPGVRLMGKVPRDQLVRLMASASVVVVPSRYEGYGLPALEAMACGVPVVAARCSALPEVVGTHGILVEPDADGVADGISAALTGPNEISLVEARLVARSRTWSASAEQYERIYRQVLEEVG
jgi:glycosyltransferase involved in cell wall biosynthesis